MLIETMKSANWLTLVAGRPAPLHSPPLLARLLIVRVLLEFAQEPALLQLHVEALERRVDAFIRLNGYVDQTGS